MTESPAGPRSAGPDCVLCGGITRRLFEVTGYWVRGCGSCGHQFAELAAQAGHVERVYGDDYFSGGGAGYSDYLSEERLRVDRGRWYARCMARYIRPGTLLDVGAAAGFALHGFAAAGWQVMGVEPNAKMAEYARQRFGVPVEVGSFESWTAQRTFDLVTMLQVLPHFFDPRAAILKAARIVHPGGYLLIETWDRSSWTAKLFGKNWHEYSPPSVLHWFSRDGLSRLVNGAGFESVAHGRPSKWIDAAHAKSLLRHKSPGSLASRLLLKIARIIPDKFAMPYPSEDLFWMLFRKQAPLGQHGRGG